MPWSSQAVIAETVIVEGPSGGLFVYDASGNLSSAAVGQTTTDPIQGITCYAGFSTFNAFGAVISLFSSTLDAQFWYTDTGTSTQGALATSIAATATGTDPFGNAYVSGITNYQPSSTVIEITASALFGFSNNPGTKVTKASEYQFIDAITNAATPAVQIASPGTGNNRTQLNMTGESQDTTSPAAFLASLLLGAQVTTAFFEIQAPSGQTVLEVVPSSATGQVLATRTSGDTNDRLSVDGNGSIQWGSGSAGPDCSLNRLSANLLRVVTADFAVTTLGRGLRVREGANCKQGTATLTAGTVVVANTSVTASSRIFLTAQDNSSTGALRVSARTAGTSFTITSSNAGDSGVVAFEIFEPG